MKSAPFILQKLKAQQAVVLLYVLDSKGSSPGRKGFNMAVAADGVYEGTIGGGIMEVKLLELAKNKLLNGDLSVVIKQQYHDKVHTHNQSGMICSGEQTVALIPLTDKDIQTVEILCSETHNTIQLDENGLSITTQRVSDTLFAQIVPNYPIFFTPRKSKRVHIFGGGHVSLALSQLLSLLDFEIIVYDHRHELSTIQQNTFAHHTRIIDYDTDIQHIPFEKEDAIVIVSFSYRTDKQILLQLSNVQVRYMGMMGSATKVKTLFDELITEGVSATFLSNISSPIGLKIHSKTTMEIAVSIAAELIATYNR